VEDEPPMDLVLCLLCIQVSREREQVLNFLSHVKCEVGLREHRGPRVSHGQN
jgi:hypothetical protein